jgi:hypothetical protein
MSLPRPLHQSVVESVLSKLPTAARQGISKDLLTTANDQFRVLGIKAPQQGQLGKGDSQESRAALILERVFRMDGSMQKLDLGVLAKAVLISRPHLEKLQLKVDNYLTETKTAKSSQASSNRGDIGRASLGVYSNELVSHRSRRGAQGPKPSSIPQLSIKLGSFVDDSHGIGHKAQQLYNDIDTYMKTSPLINEHTRRDHKGELLRHQAVYEAVCFFLVANATSSHTTHCSSKSELLQLNHVLDATGIPSLLWREIFPTADNFRLAVEQTKQQQVANRNKRGRGDRVVVAAQKRLNSAGGNAEEREKQAESNATMEQLLQLAAANLTSESAPLSSSSSSAANPTTTIWPRSMDLSEPIPDDYITEQKEKIRKIVEIEQAKARLEHGEEITEKEARRRAIHSHAIMLGLSCLNEDGTRTATMTAMLARFA